MQSSQFKISGILQPFLVPKPHNCWRPILDLSKPNLSETIRTNPLTRGVGYLNRFQGHLLPYTNTGTVQEISEISCPGSDIPVKSTAFQFVHNTHGVHCSSKGGETDGHTEGYKNPPVPRRQVGESQIPPGLSPEYSRSSENMPRTRLAGELGEIGTGTQVRQFDLRSGRVQPTPDRWQSLQDKILKLLSLPACPVW